MKSLQFLCNRLVRASCIYDAMTLTIIIVIIMMHDVDVLSANYSLMTFSSKHVTLNNIQL